MNKSCCCFLLIDTCQTLALKNKSFGFALAISWFSNHIFWLSPHAWISDPPHEWFQSIHSSSCFRLWFSHPLAWPAASQCFHITFKRGHPAAFVFSKLSPVIWHFTSHTISDAPLFCPCLVRRRRSHLVFSISPAPSSTILIRSPVKGNRGHQAVYRLWGDQGSTSPPTVWGHGVFPGPAPLLYAGQQGFTQSRCRGVPPVRLTAALTLIPTQAAHGKWTQREGWMLATKPCCQLGEYCRSSFTFVTQL